MALLSLNSKKEFSVKNMIHKRLAGWEPARDHKNLHASELMKDLEFCPREYALLDLTKGKKKDQYIGTALRATFDHGKDVESRIRNDWLRDAAVGRWKCVGCKTLTKFGKAPKTPCPTCKCDTYLYEEERFTSTSSGITGGVDLFLDVGSLQHRLVEVKSIDKDQFKDLKAPLSEHKFRTSLYLRLIEESFKQTGKFLNKGLSATPDTINVNKGHLLYVSKSFGFKDTTLAEQGISDAPFSPFKEFIIERDDTLTQTSINKARALFIFRKTPEQGLPCGVCPNALVKRAQKCSAISSCFSGKFPANITWIENGVQKHPGKKLL